MTMIRTLARSSIAPIFLTGGLDALRHPQSKSSKAKIVAQPLAEILGTSNDPVQLVRINGGVQFAAGTLLLLGWAPRLASTVLAASLVPTTLAGHRFWEEKDPVVRSQERTAFLKNCAMVGGLLLAAVDKDGAPSLRWRTDKAAHRVATNATDGVSRASTAVFGSKSKATKFKAGAMAAAALFGRNARKAVEHAASVGAEQTSRAAGMGADHLADFGKQATNTATKLGQTLADTLSDVVEVAGQKASALTSR
jgi:putative oxidoreductase